MEKKIEIIKAEIINEVIFANGNVLAIGDIFDDGRIIMFREVEGGIEVVLEWEWDGWSVCLDENGEEVEVD